MSERKELRRNQKPPRVSESKPAALSPGDSSPTYLENEKIRRLPNNLKQFIVDQNYDQYTPMNHAVWRYIMRQNLAFLKDHAHQAYVDGLSSTGIEIDRIPSIEHMNEVLAAIGWAAVTVDGFIPPAAFMEFQAHRVLVIAADMRQIEHLSYTPAPDIVHEAAGHAPMIADSRYAEYLRRFGDFGSKAMSSRKDFELYEAIRHLSILKETPEADPEEVKKAEADVEFKQKNLGKPSEMALLSRLHWYTVEYGLIGSMDDPRIYGAGLLSSIGESSGCLKDDVKKIPYGLDTADYVFDITTKQPQLFVTPSFDHLINVLETFADSMAFRTGELEGLNKAIECGSVSTCLYSSGLQLSGVFTEVLTDKQNRPAYLKTTGPTALAWDNKQLQGHSKSRHAEGFGSPIGALEGGRELESLSKNELSEIGLKVGSKATIKFESGIKVTGTLTNGLWKNDLLILLTFDNCTVTHNGNLLFKPEWGEYDMAVGTSITSVFSSAADKDAFEPVSLVPRERTIKIKQDTATQSLHALYQKVTDYRDNSCTDADLAELFATVSSKQPSDWLLPLEILEIVVKQKVSSQLETKIRTYLNQQRSRCPQYAELIDNGLALLAS